MATTDSDRPAPRTFLSYSWDDDEHKEWVKQLAIRLRTQGVDVTLDRWHAVPGDQLPKFMERAIRESDFVIVVCTPRYKEKSDRRGGGVGYEGDIITGEVFTTGNHRKFIPVLRSGVWKDAAPSWLSGKYFIDLSGDRYQESNYQELLQTLHGEREEAPPLGPRPIFLDPKGPIARPAPALVDPRNGSSTPRHPSTVMPLPESTARRDANLLRAFLAGSVGTALSAGEYYFAVFLPLPSTLRLQGLVAVVVFNFMSAWIVEYHLARIGSRPMTTGIAAIVAFFAFLCGFYYCESYWKREEGFLAAFACYVAEPIAFGLCFASITAAILTATILVMRRGKGTDADPSARDNGVFAESFVEPSTQEVAQCSREGDDTMGKADGDSQ